MKRLTDVKKQTNMMIKLKENDSMKKKQRNLWKKLEIVMNKQK